jgi:hypothetical protein
MSPSLSESVLYLCTFEQGQDVPDSCCLYDVVGCGSGILNLPLEQVRRFTFRLITQSPC